MKTLLAAVMPFLFMSKANAHTDNSKTIKKSQIPNTVKDPQIGEIIVKCAGIVKKGKNHCGANGHPCHTLGEKDFDPNEWIYVRKAVCEATPGKILIEKTVVK